MLVSQRAAAAAPNPSRSPLLWRLQARLACHRTAITQQWQGGRRGSYAAAAAVPPAAAAAAAAPEAVAPQLAPAAPAAGAAQTHFTSLYIRDFALIQEQRLQLAPGLTAITGERRRCAVGRGWPAPPAAAHRRSPSHLTCSSIAWTSMSFSAGESGSGKSVLVEALGQVLGAGADDEAVRPPASTSERAQPAALLLCWLCLQTAQCRCCISKCGASAAAQPSPQLASTLPHTPFCRACSRGGGDRGGGAGRPAAAAPPAAHAGRVAEGGSRPGHSHAAAGAQQGGRWQHTQQVLCQRQPRLGWGRGSAGGAC